MSDQAKKMVVPVAPTRAMWAAAGTAVTDLQQRGIGHHDKLAEAVWTAMLAEAVFADVDDGGCVKRRFIIIREPGKAPVKKGGWSNDEHVLAFIYDLLLLTWPTGTEFTVLELTWNDDLWVESLREWLWPFENGPGSRKATRARKEAAKARHAAIYGGGGA